jgi:creatinine amidohydrolase
MTGTDVPEANAGLGSPVDLAELNWSAVERHLADDCRIVVPLGATEEHGALSLASDTLFIDHVTRGACLRAGVLRAPTMPFGCSSFAVSYPGTISLRAATMAHVIEDVVDCLYRQGFRRIVFVTGHGGNEVITGVISEVHLDRPQVNVYYRNAWEGMTGEVHRISDERDLGRAEHASWIEVQPETRVGPVPTGLKRFPDTPDFPLFPLNSRTAREHLGDGVVEGAYDLGDAAELARLRELCVDHLATFLGVLPPTPAPR